MNHLCIENLLIGGPPELANSTIEGVGRYVKLSDWRDNGTRWAYYDPKTDMWLYISPSPMEVIERSSENRHRIVDCNECKHRLLCLVKLSAKKAFEPL